MLNFKKIFILIFLLFNSLSIFISCDQTSNLEVHFIDIGQGDSILIKTNFNNILIDSGPNDSEERLLKYLRKNNINTLDYLISTHPHEDHIGNHDAILKNLKVKNILAPKTIYDSLDFNNMKKELLKQNLLIEIVDTNHSKIYLDSDTFLEFLHPTSSKYENINNESATIKLTHFDNTFLFTGDIEKDAELELLNYKEILNSKVLKVAHHGSSTSSTLEFLTAVSPEISVISCGIKNKFNHPSNASLINLNSVNSKIYRTDEDGTIILVSDGLNINKK
ncbi:MAG: ComEC/Rec2 family competence protein [Sarcina sp.]